MISHEELITRPWYSTYQALDIEGELAAIEPRSAADWVAAHARNIGDNDALIFLGHRITYKQLDDYGNRFANMLKELGCKKGDVVGICLPNSPQWAVAVVGTLKLGCVVSGLSPLMAPPEIIHQVNDAKVKVLLTLDQLFNDTVVPIDGKVPGLKAVVITSPLDMLPANDPQVAELLKLIPAVELSPMKSAPVVLLSEALRTASPEAVATRFDPDDTIYIQYTGGTTGQPKGAQLTLANMANNALQGQTFNAYVYGEETMAAAFPFFTLAGLCFLTIGLQMGARYLLIHNPRDLAHFCAEMKKYPPTMLANVPTLYQMLTDFPAFAEVDFSALRVAVSGAAPFPVESIKKLEAIIGKNKLSEVYGMTETSPLLTCNPGERLKVGTVGIPVVGTDIKIICADNLDREMPLGEPGEIIARGPQVMKGYLNLPEVSARAMGEFEGYQWYFTGDIGTMDEEGYITICDRSKDMLIVGGFKVFSVEVESKLKELGFIELAALIGVPDEDRPGSEVVNLYVQLAEQDKARSHDQLENEIIDFCRANMAAYKVPRHIHFIDEMPLTPIGKIDKKSLRQV